MQRARTEPRTGGKTLHRMLERSTPFGIIETPSRAPLEPLDTNNVVKFKGFQGISSIERHDCRKLTWKVKLSENIHRIGVFFPRQAVAYLGHQFPARLEFLQHEAVREADVSPQSWSGAIKTTTLKPFRTSHGKHYMVLRGFKGGP